MYNFTIILFCLISKLAKKIVKHAAGYREENAACKVMADYLWLKPVFKV